MGGSVRAGKSTIVEWVKQIENVNTILDIGAGAGTYYNLFVQDNGMLKNSNWLAVEAWKPYIDKFQLTKKYNNVLNEDVRKINWNNLNNIDITIMGDVLEHMTKEDAITVVDNVMSRSRYAIISIPVKHWPQGAIENNPFEIHVKDDWSMDEVNETFSKYIIKAEKAGKGIGVFLLQK